MKDWVKIETFQRIHQAELRKDILEKNGIAAVIINERDSLFLLGNIELYVNKFDEAKAKELIGEFYGLAKINSFVGERQMRTYCNFLLEHDLDPIVKRKSDSKFILDNFEIYVKNEDLEKVVPYLKEENLEGWTKVRVCDSVSQTKYRTDLLDEKKIENFVIKRKDSDYHIEQIEIYVKTDDQEKAKSILNNLNGWVSIRVYDEKHFAEKDEDILNEHNMKALIEIKDDKKFELLVEASKEEDAIDQINVTKEWITLKVYTNIESALRAKTILQENNIHAVIVNEKDSSFLFGEIELHVEEDKQTQANELIKDL